MGTILPGLGGACQQENAIIRSVRQSSRALARANSVDATADRLTGESWRCEQSSRDTTFSTAFAQAFQVGEKESGVKMRAIDVNARTVAAEID